MAALEKYEIKPGVETTLVKDLEAEVNDYNRLCASLRAIRLLVSEHRFEETQEFCDGLRHLAEGIRHPAVPRPTVSPLLRRPDRRDGGAEGAAPEYSRAYLRLHMAQRAALSEMKATIDVIADLRFHTGSLLATLRGSDKPTYDAQGPAAARGGTAQ